MARLLVLLTMVMYTNFFDVSFGQGASLQEREACLKQVQQYYPISDAVALCANADTEFPARCGLNSLSFLSESQSVRLCRYSRSLESFSCAQKYINNGYSEENTVTFCAAPYVEKPFESEFSKECKRALKSTAVDTDVGAIEILCSTSIDTSAPTQCMKSALYTLDSSIQNDFSSLYSILLLCQNAVDSSPIECAGKYFQIPIIAQNKDDSDPVNIRGVSSACSIRRQSDPGGQAPYQARLNCLQNLIPWNFLESINGIDAITAAQVICGNAINNEPARCFNDFYSWTKRDPANKKFFNTVTIQNCAANNFGIVKRPAGLDQTSTPPVVTPTPTPGIGRCNSVKLAQCLKFQGGDSCYDKWQCQRP